MIKKHFGPNVEIGVQWIKRGDDTCGAIFVASCGILLVARDALRRSRALLMPNLL